MMAIPWGAHSTIIGAGGIAGGIQQERHGWRCGRAMRPRAKGEPRKIPGTGTTYPRLISLTFIGCVTDAAAVIETVEQTGWCLARFPPRPAIQERRRPAAVPGCRVGSSQSA